MDIEYTPSLAKGKDAKFKGCVTLKAPTIVERYSYVDQCGFKVTESGEVDQSLANVSAMGKMIEISKPHYKKVALTHLKSGREYKNFDDLSLDPECDGILVDVAGTVMNGLRPSKN